MKKILLIVLASLMAEVAIAQKMIVYSIKGKVEDVSTGSPRQVRLRDALTPATVLNIPYQGCVVLFDEASSKQFTLKNPGRATVREMIADNRNSVQKLTSDYMSFIKKQITSGGQVQLRNCSDPATVTRSLQITEPEDSEGLLLCGRDGFSKENPFKKDFDDFRKKMHQDYQAFRKEILENYANFVRNPWSEVKLSPAEEKPKDEKIKPYVVEQDKGGKPILPDFDKQGQDDKKVEPEPLVISVLPLPQPLPLPEPVVPVIKENKDVVQYHTFKFYGTEMKVRWSDDCKFQLKGTDENSIADGVELLSADKYNNLLLDCMELRKQYQLSDWAYYLMLKEMSASVLGKDTNEATLLMAMLYCQSGYKMRLAMVDNKLTMMISTQFYLYGRNYFVIDGINYYLMEGNAESVHICEASFKKEQEMSLVMTESPRFQVNSSEERTITSTVYPEIHASVSVNKNLMDFYSTYPSSYFNNDFMTRWAMYANMEMQPEVREQLYPQLKALIEGKSQRDAAGCILRWIQTGFEYEYDEDVWGHDRAFFAEESLFYPSCDCEDRSILYTRLIRDIMGLKCILVFYPGHLACAVQFTEEVEGDHIDVNGDRYTVCDPTIMGHGAPVGWTMRGMDNSQASVIVLQ